MQKKSAIEMERIKILKAYRTLIRLKHSLAADEEINETIPDTLFEFEQSIQRGELPALLLENLDEVFNVG